MKMVPLPTIHSNEPRQIRRILGKAETKRHLEELGFVVGEDISIVSQFGGNLIINVKGSRVALDKTLAMQILI